MEQSDDRTDCKRKLKAEGDVNENPKDAESERPKRVAGEFAADEGADAFFALDFEFAIRDRVADGVLHFVARVERQAQGDEVARALRRLLDRLVIEMERLERIADLRDLHGRRGAERKQVAAFKINTEIAIAPDDKRGRAGDEQGERAHAGDETFAQEVNVLRGDKMEHRDPLHAAGVD